MEKIGLALVLTGIGLCAYSLTINNDFEEGTEEYKKLKEYSTKLSLAGAFLSVSGFVFSTLSYKK